MELPPDDYGGEQEPELLPEDIFGKSTSRDIASLFLTITYEYLKKIGLKLPKLVDFTDDSPQDLFFFTTNDTHNVTMIIQRNENDEVYKAKINVLIVLHQRDLYITAGWQAADNLMTLLANDKRELCKSLINEINSELTVWDADTQENVRGNINGRWNINIKRASLHPYNSFEFEPIDAYFYTQHKTVVGSAVEFSYRVNILDEEEFDPYGGEKKMIKKKSKAYEENRSKRGKK